MILRDHIRCTPTTNVTVLALLIVLVSATASFAQTEEPAQVESETTPSEEVIEDEGIVLEDDADETLETLIARFLENPENFLTTESPEIIETVIENVLLRDPGTIEIILGVEGLLDAARRASVATGVSRAIVTLSSDGRAEEVAQLIATVASTASSAFALDVSAQVQVLAAASGVDSIPTFPEILSDETDAPPDIIGEDNATGGISGDDGAAQTASTNPSASTSPTSTDAGSTDPGVSEGATDPDVSPVD